MNRLGGLIDYLGVKLVYKQGKRKAVKLKIIDDFISLQPLFLRLIDYESLKKYNSNRQEG